MDQSASSAGSTSPSGDPSPSASTEHTPTLTRLIKHFVSSKRSLTTTSAQLRRADELVTDSRDLVEEIAVLTARTVFAKQEICLQLDILQAIRVQFAGTASHAENEMKQHLSTLDSATQRLDETLHIIRTTNVDASLQPRTANRSPGTEIADPNEGQHETVPKTLFDFIDEGKHEEILTALRTLVDSFFQGTLAGISQTTGEFDEMLINISVASTNAENELLDKLETHDMPVPGIPELYRGMEEHASEMAKLLHSLVTHYDLCVTALKHTEGGGQAAREAMRAEELHKMSTAGPEESFYHQPVPETISDADHAEMLGILENDAQHVEDVVGEVHDRIADMETQHAQLSQHLSRVRSAHAHILHGIHLLDSVRTQLATYAASHRSARESWQQIRTDLATQTAALDEMTDFYTSFLAGYDKLLQEISRRATHAEKTKAVAMRAQRELERLWDADQDMRRRFFAEVGSHLPQDLYPAFQAEGTRWEVNAVEPNWDRMD